MTRISKDAAGRKQGLVVTRTPGQGVVIKGVGRVVVETARNGRARLRFELPRHIEVERDEVHARGIAAAAQKEVA